MASTTAPPSVPPPPSSDRLDSWKEIAAYLNRSVKTVQRWEQEEALPVRRHQHGQLGSLYAWRAELDDWWEARRPVLNHDAADPPQAMEETGGAPALTPAPAGRRWNLPLAFLLTGVVAAVAGASVMWLLRPAALRSPVVRLNLDVQPAQELNAGAGRPSARTPGGSATAMAWTPDGQTMVFLGQRDGVRQVYVRPLDAAEARPLANTEGARLLAVSPDGEWVAFWSAPPGQAEPSSGAIRKVPLRGGPAIDLATDVRVCPRGLVWGEGGRLFFGQEDGPISQLDAEGARRAITTLREGELRHVFPWPLPGGRALLYTVRKRLGGWGDEEVVAQSLATGERKVLVRDGADARYLPSGHVVFLRRGVLFAVPFDSERLQVLAKEVPVLEGVTQALTGGTIWDNTGAGQFAISATGALAWVPGPVVSDPGRKLIAVDRAGRVTPLSAPARSYIGRVSLSPDAHRLAVLISKVSGTEIWVFDLNRGTLAPLNHGGEAGSSTWSPDGRFIVFRWIKDGRFSIASQVADGSGPPSVLARGFLVPTSFAPDGRHLLAVQGSTNYDIVVVGLDSPGSVQPLVATEKQEQWPAVSPDGRWLAYGSDDSGRDETYVRPYPGPGPARQVSVEGGDNPAWNPNGRELFFLGPPDASGSRRMMAADFLPAVSAAGGPRIGRPRVLFAFPPRDVGVTCRPARCYDVAPDGQHFYAVHSPTPPPPPPVVTHINIIQNWLAELKTKMPPGR